MRSKWRDSVATALVGGVAAAYVGYLAEMDVSLIESTRGMAVLALILGWASRVIGGHSGFPRGPISRIARVGNFGSIAIGITAIATESGVVLLISIGSIIALWMLAAIYGLAPQRRVALRRVH